jgi:hypothetical protein
VSGSARASALLLLVLGLIGADVSPFPTPVVVVYPLTTTGAANSDVGGNVAILLSTKLAELGGLTIKPFTPGTQRPQFLDSATQTGADYYITGYMTPVGSDMTLIAQVVSTHSGSIVFSTTALVRTYGDVIGQADVLREAILRHAGRGFPAVDQPAPAPTDTAEPSGSAGVNLSRALSHHARASATPTSAPSGPAAVAAAASSGPAVVASPGAPARRGPAPQATGNATPQPAAATVAGIVDARGDFAGLVTYVDGDGTPGQRSDAQTRLSAALRASGMNGGGMLPVAAAGVASNARALCGANVGAKVIFASMLVLGSGAYGKDSVTLVTAAHGCDGRLIAQAQAVENAAAWGGVSNAIARAATSVATGLAKQLRAERTGGSS